MIIGNTTITGRDKHCGEMQMLQANNEPRIFMLIKNIITYYST